MPSPFIQVVKGRSGILTVVKRAEDGRGIILRLVESYGQHDTVVLRCLHPIRAAIESDLLERPLPAPATAPTPSVNGAEVTVSLAPWEIKTVRVIFE